MKKMRAMVELTAQLAQAPASLLGTKNGFLFRTLLSLRLAPVWRQPIGVGAGSMSFAAASPQALYRAWTSLTKEPDTIAWIDGFTPGSTFFDIGANVGVFALYAAAAGHLVHAFEPVAENHMTLQKNIELNGFGNAAQCYCVAIDARDGVGSLYVDQTNAGGTSQFGVRTDSSQARRGSICRTLDSLIFEDGLPFPAYMKIDVDGNEGKILAGGAKTMSDPRLRAVHMELNGGDDAKNALRTGMRKHGFGAVPGVRNNVTFAR
jgi:FkbM family methyltransferase